MKHIKLFENFQLTDISVNNINESWTENPDYDKFFAELVASSGKSDTVEGEMLRAISKIVYRYNNDGDYFFKGYGKETAGPAYNYLVRVSPLSKELKPLFNQAKTGYLRGDHPDQYSKKDPYSVNLEKAVTVIIDYIKGKNGKYEANTVDMYDSEIKPKPRRRY